MLNPVHLRTLAVVVRCGSFADAARELGYTSSAVSQQIAALERQMRLRLFEREAHSIRPTPAGEAVALRAAAVLGSLTALEEDVAALAGGRAGTLRIGSFPTATAALLPQVLSSLHLRRPQLDVRLDEQEPVPSLQLLRARELDVALVYEYGSSSPLPRTGVDLHPVLTEDLVLVTSAQMDEEPGLAAHADAAWIGTREDTAAAAVLRLLCAAEGFEPRVALRSNNYGVVQELVSKRLGVALVPALALLDLPTLRRSRLPEPRPLRQVAVAASPLVPAELVDEFVGLVRAAAAALTGPGSGIRAWTAGDER